MSDTKHTPGPWVPFLDHGIPAAIMPAGRPGDICVMRYLNTDHSNADEVRANAALIASAPALLAALEAQSCSLCRNTGRWTPHCFKCDDSGEDHTDCPKAEDCDNAACLLRRAAIAAAKGER